MRHDSTAQISSALVGGFGAGRHENHGNPIVIEPIGTFMECQLLLKVSAELFHVGTRRAGAAENYHLAMQGFSLGSLEFALNVGIQLSRREQPIGLHWRRRPLLSLQGQQPDDSQGSRGNDGGGEGLRPADVDHA